MIELFLPFIFLCHSTPINDWKGDQDTGPTCVRFYDLMTVDGYPVKKCQARLDEMEAEMLLGMDEIERHVPKPWRIKKVCEQNKELSVKNSDRLGERFLN